MLKPFIYRSLCLLDRWQGFMHTRPTALGRLVMGFTLAAGVFGVDTRMNLLHQAFALGLGLLLFSSLSALLMQRRLRQRLALQRGLPRYATLDQSLSYPLLIRPEQRRRLQGCFIEEQLPDPRPSLAQFRRPDAESASDSAFDRLMGYPRWRRLHRANRWADWPEAVPLRGPLEQGQLRLNLCLRPRRRGRLCLSGLVLTRPDPLGLFRSRVFFPAPASLLVLPRRYPLAPLALPGRRCFQPGGWGLAAKVGDSQEFIGLRDYRPGDSPRAIHWPSWARSGKPQVREFQDEYFNRQALLLDNLSWPGDPRFEASLSVAASLCEAMQGRDSLLDLIFFSAQGEPLTAGRGLAGSAQLLELLASVQASETGDLGLLQGQLLAQRDRLSALVLLLLAWDEPRQALVAGLQASGLPLEVLVMAQAQPDPAQDQARPPPAGLRLHWIRPHHLAEDLGRLNTATQGRP
ncbi:MAG: DUF58 domain-containing protein [Gammaproteobacteria bacterium SHHR-1]